MRAMTIVRFAGLIFGVTFALRSQDATVHLVPFSATVGQVLEIEETVASTTLVNAKLSTDLAVKVSPTSSSFQASQQSKLRMSVMTLAGSTPDSMKLAYVASEGGVTESANQSPALQLKGRTFRVSRKQSNIVVEAEDGQRITDPERVAVSSDFKTFTDLFRLKAAFASLAFPLNVPVRVPPQIAAAIFGSFSKPPEAISDLTLTLVAVRDAPSRAFDFQLTVTLQIPFVDTVQPTRNKSVSVPTKGVVTISEDCKAVRADLQADVTSSVNISDGTTKSKSSVDGGGSMKITLDRKVSSI